MRKKILKRMNYKQEDDGNEKYNKEKITIKKAIIKRNKILVSNVLCL